MSSIKNNLPLSIQIGFSEPVAMPPLGLQSSVNFTPGVNPRQSRKVTSGDRRRARRAQLDAFRDATRDLLAWMRRVLPGVRLVTQVTKSPPDAVSMSRAEELRLAEREEAAAATVQAAKYFVIVLDAKGGLGKSLMSQVAYETLSGPGRNVLVIDADKVNSNLSKIGLTKKEMPCGLTERTSRDSCSMPRSSWRWVWSMLW